MQTTLHVNGTCHSLNLEARTTLLDALREHLGLTGPKKGCDHGQCGACTVHINGRRSLSCMTLAVMHPDDPITTIEGLSQGDRLHPVQAAFLRHDGFQCGFCTPGQIMSAAALHAEQIPPDPDAIREALSGNLCRCGAYVDIIAAVQEVLESERARADTDPNPGEGPADEVSVAARGSALQPAGAPGPVVVEVPAEVRDGTL